MFIHKTAIVASPELIGENTKIWHWVHIMKGARIGKNCVFGQNVYIGSDVKIGNNVRVQNNVSIYDKVYLENDVFCGPSMVFTNVINPRSHIERKKEYRITHVRQGASIGANATIVCGNEIGKYCFIGAGSVVTKEVKPFALVVGNPARQIGWVSKAGQKLEFNNLGFASCPEGHEKYQLKEGFVDLII